MPIDDIEQRSLPIDYDELGLASIRDREYLAHSSLLGTVMDNFAGNFHLIIKNRNKNYF